MLMSSEFYFYHKSAKFGFFISSYTDGEVFEKFTRLCVLTLTAGLLSPTLTIF